MDIPEVDKQPSNNDQEKAAYSEGKLWGDAMKEPVPSVVVSSTDQEIMASGDQTETPVMSPATSPSISTTQQGQLSNLSTTNDQLAAGDTPVAATMSSTLQLDKTDQPSVILSVSANPIVSTSSETVQALTSSGGISNTITSDPPPRPMSPDIDNKVKEGNSHSSVTTHQFFPDLETSLSHEHTNSASVMDSFTHDDTLSSKGEKEILDKIRSDKTLGGNSAEGPSTSGWTTDSEESVSNQYHLIPYMCILLCLIVCCQNNYYELILSVCVGQP